MSFNDFKKKEAQLRDADAKLIKPEVVKKVVEAAIKPKTKKTAS